MNVYETKTIAERITGNPYVGRGIVIGKSADATKACTAYFIMGRSANSRNRVFSKEDGVLYTKPFDDSKVEDPSLIIYAALREYDNRLIVTNGDQTDTIYEGLKEGKSFTDSLSTRCFEPDAPNFTPRISGMLTFDAGDFSYKMSILKSADETGTACNRYTFFYESLAGTGHFDIDAFAAELWEALDADNRISLYVRYTDLTDGQIQERIFNKHEGD